MPDKKVCPVTTLTMIANFRSAQGIFRQRKRHLKTQLFDRYVDNGVCWSRRCPGGQNWIEPKSDLKKFGNGVKHFYQLFLKSNFGAIFCRIFCRSA